MMFFVQFEATPNDDHAEADAVGGAFVNCWIERPTMAEAEHVAREMIAASGWIADDIEEASVVDRSTYANNPGGLQYFEQALLDKEVLVFHTYPLADAPAEDDTDCSINQ